MAHIKLAHVLRVVDNVGCAVRHQFYIRIRKYYTVIVDVFDYYCTVGTGDPFSIQLNAFLEMCDNAGISGRHSLSGQDLQALFVAVNVEEGPKDTVVNKANLDRALMRFEMIEFVARVATAWTERNFVKSCVEGIVILIEELFLRNLPSVVRKVVCATHMASPLLPGRLMFWLTCTDG